MRRRLFPGLVIACLAGVVGAALLHLIIVLSLPSFSQRDAYTRILAEGEIHQFYRLGDMPDRAGLQKDDPFIDLSVCGFDVSEGPVRLTAVADGVPFWSLALYDSASNEVFSINDRTSSGGRLDLVIATPAQLTQLRKDLPETISQAILVETKSADGYAVLRALSPQASYSQAVGQFLKQASCAPFEWRLRTRF